jgi:hypothetical protein
MTALWPSPEPASIDGALAAVDPFRNFSFSQILLSDEHLLALKLNAITLSSKRCQTKVITCFCTANSIDAMYSSQQTCGFNSNQHIQGRTRLEGLAG